MQKLAASGDSAYVRLQLASALQRLVAKDRWPIADALVRNKQDAKDQNLPLMIWYGIEPLIDSNLRRFVELAKHSEIPIVRRHIARRVAGRPDDAQGIELLVRLLRDSSDKSRVQDVLEGILVGLQGTRTKSMPDGWPQTFEHLTQLNDAPIRQDALRLALIFDDPAALKQLREIAANPKELKDYRQEAIQSLVQKKPANLPDLLLTLLSDSDTQNSALLRLGGVFRSSDCQEDSRIIFQPECIGPAECSADVSFSQQLGVNAP